jgi:hypothetical protein
MNTNDTRRQALRPVAGLTALLLLAAALHSRCVPFPAASSGGFLAFRPRKAASLSE